MTTSLKAFAGVALLVGTLTLGCASSPETSAAPEPAAPRVVSEQEVVLVHLTGLT